MNKLPDSLVLCSALDKETAVHNLNYSVLGSFYSMVVLSRSDTEIQFGRTNAITYPNVIYPYFLTSPETPPRSVIHEFDSNVRGVEIEEER